MIRCFETSQYKIIGYFFDLVLVTYFLNRNFEAQGSSSFHRAENVPGTTFQKGTKNLTFPSTQNGVGPIL